MIQSAGFTDEEMRVMTASNPAALFKVGDGAFP